jgi:hypothetical protein
MRNIVRIFILLVLIIGLTSYYTNCGGGDSQQEADTQEQVNGDGDDGTDGDGNGGDGDGDGNGPTTKIPLNIFEFGDLMVDAIADKLARAYFEIYSASFAGVAKYVGAREDIFTVPDFSQPVTYDKEGVKLMCNEGNASEYDLRCLARLNFDAGDVHVEGDCEVFLNSQDTTMEFELDDGVAKLTIQLYPGVYEEEGSNPYLPGILITYADKIRLVTGFYNLTSDRLVQELVLQIFIESMYLNEASGGYTGTPYDDRIAHLYFPTLDDGEHIWVACIFGPGEDNYECGNIYTMIERCSDKVDNDADGLIDCDDPDCGPCVIECAFENCENGVDDDDNGLADCEDQDCHFHYACFEVCDNLTDDDGDGLIDCDDLACFDQFHCGEQICDDGVDNDGNGATDCDDPYCNINDVNCREMGMYNYKCDVDGNIMGMDLACEDYQGTYNYHLPRECVEHPVTSDVWCLEKCEQLCGDGIDNDLDGLTDCLDPDCAGIPPYCND